MTSATLQAIEPYFEGMRDYSEEKQIGIAAVLLKYASRAYSNTEARTALKNFGLPKDQAIQMREAALSVNEIVRLKYPLLDASLNRSIPNIRGLKNYCKINGVAEDDALILKSVLTSNIKNKVSKLLRSCKCSYIPHPSDVERECEEMAQDPQLINWTNRFVYRKLRGFYKAENMEQEDYVNDLMFTYSRTYKYARPYYSKLHSHHYAKRAIHNAGIRKIHFWQANKRALLIKTNSGFTNNNINLLAISKSGDTVSINKEVENISRPVDVSELSMFLMSLSQTQRLFTDKKLIALKILSLNDVQEFVGWYNNKFLTSYKTTKEIFFQYKNEKEYIDVVRRYFKLTPANMSKLLCEFRDALNGTKNGVILRKTA